MQTFRHMMRPLSLFLAVVMSLILMPHQAVMAKMISAQALLNAGRVDQSRATLRSVLARDDVRAALVSQGIAVEEAMARVEALSDAEIVALADRLDHLPAGGSGLGVIVGAAVVVFIVLLITDILGFTDVFTFVKKHR